MTIEVFCRFVEENGIKEQGKNSLNLFFSFFAFQIKMVLFQFQSSFSFQGKP